MAMNEAAHRPWRWIPTVYFAEGIPYVVTMTVSVIMYKRLGLSNADIALYTSWLYLPWVIKPFWSPIVDIIGDRRQWIIAMQLLVGAAFALVALTLPGDNFFRYSLAVFWLVAFSSATHDIAADGYYIESLNENDQAWFVGIRSTFYRLATISAQGLLVMAAGYAETAFGDITLAWMIACALLAATFVLLAAYHSFALPKAQHSGTASPVDLSVVPKEFVAVLVSFFKKKHIVKILLFLLVYRFAEAQLAKLAGPFLLDDIESGGLALSTASVGLTYGTVGVLMLTLGGILGGILAAKHGLRRWLWWMVAAINLPNVAYIVLAFGQPSHILWINFAVAVEQFGYGFGFTAYMLFMIVVARGPNSTAHFALCTAFMALGMMLPGMVSGHIQAFLGYEYFFVWVLIATLPSFLVAFLAAEVIHDYEKKQQLPEP